MNKDITTTTIEPHEMLLDAIRAANEEAIMCGCVPTTVVIQIEEATRRLRDRVRGAAAGRHVELLDELDLAEWERSVPLQAAVLAAMLCNEL